MNSVMARKAVSMPSGANFRAKPRKRASSPVRRVPSAATVPCTSICCGISRAMLRATPPSRPAVTGPCLVPSNSVESDQSSTSFTQYLKGYSCSTSGPQYGGTLLVPEMRAHDSAPPLCATGAAGAWP